MNYFEHEWTDVKLHILTNEDYDAAGNPIGSHAAGDWESGIPRTKGGVYFDAVCHLLHG